jgi:hypothetical protein
MRFIHFAVPGGETALYCGNGEMGQGISTALPVEGSESGLFGSH